MRLRSRRAHGHATCLHRREPQRHEFLLGIGNIAGTGTPQDMAAEIRNGCPLRGEAAKKAGIQPE
jgi:hypothetical protein